MIDVFVIGFLLGAILGFLSALIVFTFPYKKKSQRKYYYESKDSHDTNPFEDKK